MWQSRICEIYYLTKKGILSNNYYNTLSQVLL